MAKLNEDVKVVMLKGEKGEKGEAGTGIPSGGKTGQAIIKASDNDYDYKWGSLVVNDVANATNDGNGNNIVNTYATKTELSIAKTDASNTYLTKTDASETYVPRIDNADNAPYYIDNKGTAQNFKLATITLKGVYLDYPIQLEIATRRRSVATLRIMFASGDTSDPDLTSFTTDSDTEFYLKKAATSTWDLYYRATVTWTRVSIKSIYNMLGEKSISITADITPVDSIPSDAIQAVNPILTQVTKLYRTTKTITFPYGGKSATIPANFSESVDISMDVLDSKAVIVSAIPHTVIAEFDGSHSTYASNVICMLSMDESGASHKGYKMDFINLSNHEQNVYGADVTFTYFIGEEDNDPTTPV